MSEEKSKADKVWKLTLITAAVIIPLLVGWLIYELVVLDSNVDKIESQRNPQYEDFDSIVWVGHRVKYKTIEKYETYTLYKLSFYDDTEANVTVKDFKELEEGDSTMLGETQTFRRLVK